MYDNIPQNSNDRGAALVIALMVLLVLVTVSAALVTTSIVDSRLSGMDQQRAKALDLAEAGVAEAITRIKSGEVPSNNNPRMTAEIFLTSAGSVPALGTDSTGLATAQPAGNWLNYSTATRSKNALTVKYKTDASRSTIYKYDNTKTLPVQTLTGMPIFQVTSTGQVGNTARTVVAEVVPQPLNLNVRGAMVSKQPVNWVGNDYFCGHDHRADTPANKGNTAAGGAGGRVPPGGCYENPGASQWEINPGGPNDLVGVWSNGTITGHTQSGNPSYCQGSPVGFSESQPAPFYTGPWDALGMTQAQFWAWVGPRQSTKPASPKGIFYLDNDGTTQNQSATYTYGALDGEGFLYVDGNLILDNNFRFKGLIYVEGNFNINNNAWILGGVIVRGTAVQNNHAGGVVLYSKDSINQNIAKYGSYATISWREVPSP